MAKSVWRAYKKYVTSGMLIHTYLFGTNDWQWLKL